jgi:hypothetical protein
MTLKYTNQERTAAVFNGASFSIAAPDDWDSIGDGPTREAVLAWLAAGNVPQPVDMPTLEQTKAAKRAEINTECDAEIGTISATYPETEVLSWDKQEREAYALDADPASYTPLIDGIAASRGITRAELASLIIAKVEQFAAFTGPLIGKRQSLEKAIEAATTVEEVAAIAW